MSNDISVSGILDIREKSAFVRSGYLAGPHDVPVSLAYIRQHGLRQGDAITGTTTRVETVNGAAPSAAFGRPQFTALTPIHPDRRLLLETSPNLLTTRVIDLIMPIGKGQRALVVSPPKAGKTSVLQAIAHGVAANDPDCALMVVLVDERPEEVTDMRRSIDGEVIASTFDRPPAEHTAIAELAIERAKRRVEMGEDVVVLFDSVTRLGRAYNLASKPSSRILSGGVDAAAIQPLKRFLGAARNIENGGSLTIIATAMVETGSTADTLFFEELKSTGNAELKLDRRIAERRVFPAVDILSSGTRRDELLLTPEELAITRELRTALLSADGRQSMEQLLGQLRGTRSNAEFLLRVADSASRVPMAA